MLFGLLSLFRVKATLMEATSNAPAKRPCRHVAGAQHSGTQILLGFIIEANKAHDRQVAPTVGPRSPTTDCLKKYLCEGFYRSSDYAAPGLAAFPSRPLERIPNGCKDYLVHLASAAYQAWKISPFRNGIGPQLAWNDAGELACLFSLQSLHF